MLSLPSSMSLAQKVEKACEGTTYDVSVCLLREYKALDAKLSICYRKALESTRNYTQHDTQKLKDAQRRWIAYTDAECNAVLGLWGGGSGGPSARTVCLITHTQARIAELEESHIIEP